MHAAGEVLHHRFIVLAVDETRAGASGCSIDASVKFLQQLQGELKTDLFDRMQFTYRDAGGSLHTVAREEFAERYRQGKITDETPVFDTLVTRLADLQTDFEKPLAQSWHARMV